MTSCSHIQAVYAVLHILCELSEPVSHRGRCTGAVHLFKSIAISDVTIGHFTASSILIGHIQHAAAEPL